MRELASRLESVTLVNMTTTIEIEVGEEAARAYAEANDAVRDAARASLEQTLADEREKTAAHQRMLDIAQQAYESSKAAGVTDAERVAAIRELGFDEEGNAV